MASNEERQAFYENCLKTNYMIEFRLDFSDCEDYYEVADAACKLLVDNFEVGYEGSYIYEIIHNACAASLNKPIVD